MKSTKSCYLIDVIFKSLATTLLLGTIKLSSRKLAFRQSTKTTLHSTKLRVKVPLKWLGFLLGLLYLIEHYVVRRGSKRKHHIERHASKNLNYILNVNNHSTLNQ
jgi:hypothetical protein